MAADVRFGSKADILGGLRDLCFTPESGHQDPLSITPRHLYAYCSFFGLENRRA
jgi:hypothetical protein